MLGGVCALKDEFDLPLNSCTIIVWSVYWTRCTVSDQLSGDLHILCILPTPSDLSFRAWPSIAHPPALCKAGKHSPEFLGRI